MEELFETLEFDVAGLSDGNQDVVPAIRRSHADMAVLEVERPGVHVQDALRELNKYPEVRVVFGSAAPSGADVHTAVAGGAAGFVALDAPLGELRHDFERARSGEPVVSSKIESLLIGEIRVQSDLSHQHPLSPRQLEVLQLIADGVSTSEIAEMLSISPLTVATHYRGIYQKLGVSSKAAGIAEGFRRGILV